MRASSADIEKAMGIVADVARMRGELDAVKAENERLRARLAEAERLLRVSWGVCENEGRRELAGEIAGWLDGKAATDSASPRHTSECERWMGASNFEPNECICGADTAGNVHD